MPAIQIPKYDSAITPDALTAPDAPMTDGPIPPQVGSVVPIATPSTAEFMDSVKESNLKRQEVKTPVQENTNTPNVKPEKVDTTPAVFKKMGEEVAPPVVEDDSGDDDSNDEPKEFVDPLEAPLVDPKPVKKNYKELKSAYKTLRARETQVRQQNDELKAEVERLAGFQERMDEYEQMKERITHLETYEKIFDIHSNPEFNAKYIVGAEQVSNQAKEIAKQYNVQDGAVIDQAVKIRNRKDLNDFLKHHVKDEIGVQDIRPYIFHLQGLEDERVQLEKSPEQARETLSTMFRESEGKRIAAVSKTIHDRGTNAWGQIEGYYAKGETAVELFKDKPGDPQHTERRTTVLKRANGEYVKVLGALAGLGIKELPAAVAHTLAARFQLSEAFGEVNAENTRLKQENAELQAQLTDTTTYTRPSFNGAGKNGNGAAPELPSGTDIASHVFTKARDTVNNRPPR